MQMIGRNLLHYEILRKLGEGGMGEVWLAHDSKLDREVAIKLLPPKMVSDSERLERFQREARAVASLNHPNIVTIHSVEEADGVPFFAMEYLDGGTLSHLIPDEGLPPAVFLNLAIPIADAVSAAHEQGVTHRDLKPGNIMVDQRGRLKVLDFGLAKLQSEALPKVHSDSHLETEFITGEGKILGTTPYMSPEQLTGRLVDQRSDIFSLGTIFYIMATGKHPFLADSSAEVISSILSHHPPIVSEVRGDLPTPLASLIRRCLEKDPDRRYQTARDLLDDLVALRDAVGRGDAPTSPVTERMTAVRRAPRLPYRFGAAALAIVALTVAAFVIGRTGQTSPPDLRSLAVLRLANLTGDAELDHLAEGMSAGLISRLREAEGLKVVARSEAWSMSDTSPAALRDGLGVGAVVDGEMLKHGTSLRHTVNLTDADTGFVLWSHTYSTPGDDAYHLQQAIARDLAVFLSIELTVDDRRRLARDTTGAHLAFDHYVNGQRFLDELDEPRGPDAAADNFSQALRIDSGFALARVGLSEALWQIYLRDLDRGALIEAEEHALAARDIDPGLAAARVALARIYRTTGRHDEAVAEVENALAGHPRPDRAYRELGRSYERVGDLDEAERALRAATSLRPDDWTNWNALGNFLAKSGSYDESREAFERAVELAPPDVSMPREKLATFKLQTGDFDAAIDIYESLPGPIRNPRLAANLGTAYFFSDRPEKWSKVEQHYLTAVRLNPQDAMFQANLGDLYQRLGRLDDAQERYLRACELLEMRVFDDPDDPKLLSELADYSAKANNCERALALSSRLEMLLPETGPAAHQMAYIYALCGEDDAAIEALARAVKLGEPAEIIRQEDEFANLRDREDFIALVGG
jgi:Flp pilus assembly protein TadD/TolB-like protein/tRNA A-37 threonylcarbamoyl transferase component Bud32